MDAMEDAEGKINGHRASAILRQLRPDLDPSMTPDPEDLAFDLDAVASGVTALRAQVPSDAHTAPYLGTEREGNAVAIHQDGLVVTIGYLILESQSVFIGDLKTSKLTINEGAMFEGNCLMVQEEVPPNMQQAEQSRSN